MNNDNPNAADAPVPPAGTEQAADQAARQQPPPAESGVLDTISGVVDIGDMVVSVLDIFG